MQRAYACVYEHPKVGVWIDLVSRFQDGTAATFSSAKDSGMERRPGSIVAYAPGVSSEALLQRLLIQRPKKALVTVDDDGLVKLFEDAYADDMAWRKNRGGSYKEVANVITSRQN